MRIKKGLLVLAAVTLPLASVVMLEGTAFAGKTTGTGTPTCHFGGTINFSPGLQPGNGSPASKETVTVSATLSSCSGNASCLAREHHRQADQDQVHHEGRQDEVRGWVRHPGDGGVDDISQIKG